MSLFQKNKSDEEFVKHGNRSRSITHRSDDRSASSHSQQPDVHLVKSCAAAAEAEAEAAADLGAVQCFTAPAGWDDSVKSELTAKLRTKNELLSLT